LILLLILGISHFGANFLIENENSTSNEFYPESSRTSLMWNYTMGDGGRGLSITPNGQYLAAGSWDRNLYLFDTSNPVPIWNKTIDGMVGEVAISDDGEYIVAASDDNNVYFFHRSSSTPLWNYTAGNLISSVAITPDGQFVVAGSWDNNIYVFNRSNSTPIFDWSFSNRVYAVDISSDGQIIVAGGLNVGVHVFNISYWITAPIWSNNSMTTVYSVDLSANDDYLVVGSLTGVTGTIFLYDILDSQPIQEYEASQTCGHVSISDDGKYFVGSVSSEYRSYLFERGYPNPKWNYTANNQIEETDISGDGNFIASGTYDNVVFLFNRPNIYASIEKTEMFCLQTYETEHWVLSVELSETGEYFAVLSNDDKIYMFHNELCQTPDGNPEPSIPFGGFLLIWSILGISTLFIIRRRYSDKKN
jgi:WD40 repeat protein